MNPKLSSLKPLKILVIRRDNIGDLVCTTPAFAAIRKHFQNAEIGALVNSYNAEVLSGNPNIDHIFVYQKLKHAGSLLNRVRALVLRLKLLMRLRNWCPDITVLAKSSFDRHGLNMARQIGAKNVIGFAPNDLRDGRSLHKPDICLEKQDSASLHEVEVIGRLLEPIGIKDALGPLQVFTDAKMVSEFSARLPVATKRVAMHISARETERRWGNNNFIELTKYVLRSQSDIQILLFWSPGPSDDPHHPGDDDAAERLICAVQSERLIPVPTQNLTELIAALSLCDLFIGADGGAMHLAVALNKKVLAMFENSMEKINHWYPWQVHSKIVHSANVEHPNIDQISVLRIEQVFRELMRH